jgi:hypothetical protein
MHETIVVNLYKSNGMAKGFLSLGRAYSVFTLFTLNWNFSMRCSSSSLVWGLFGGGLRGIVEEMRLGNSEWKQLSCVSYASTCSVIELGLQVASATGKTKDDEPKLEEEGDIDEDAGEDEEEVYEDVHNYNEVELPTFGAAEEEDYYGEYRSPMLLLY